MSATPADVDEATLLRFFRTLNERQARLCAAERALALGWGGITRLARLTGLAPRTIRNGIAELRGPMAPAQGRIRRPGGGRRKVELADPALLPALQAAVGAPTAACRAGSPMDVLRWTSTSKVELAVALAAQGHRVAPNTVGRLLRGLGYRLQANRKDKDGRAPPGRDAQALAGALEPTAAAGVLLFENVWATRFRDAVLNAHGQTRCSTPTGSCSSASASRAR